MEESKEKRMKRNEDSLTDLWDNIKRTNISIKGVPEGEDRKDPRKYPKRLYSKTSLTWERKYTPKSRKRRESQAG